jgi:hypothetical protein
LKLTGGFFKKITHGYQPEKSSCKNLLPYRDTNFGPSSLSLYRQRLPGGPLGMKMSRSFKTSVSTRTGTQHHMPQSLNAVITFILP